VVEINHSDDGESLILDYRPELKHFRQYWFEYLKESLPNTLSFWGSAFGLSLVCVYVFRNSNPEFLIFIILSGIIFTVPTLMTLFSYQDFMTSAKKQLSSLSETEKTYHLTFKPNSDGFECVSGKDFSFISWSSVKQISEKDTYFVFNCKTQPFIVPKDVFHNENELRYFRSLLTVNSSDNVQLLN
jgi:hypothetical protein